MTYKFKAKYNREILKKCLDLIADKNFYNPFLFADFVISRESELYVKKARDKYHIYFTRPLFSKKLSDYYCNYYYSFKINVIDNNYVLVEGSIKLKWIAYLAIVFFLFIYILMAIDTTPDSWLGKILFYSLPIFAVYHFIKDYLKFKSRIKLLLASIYQEQGEKK